MIVPRRINQMRLLVSLAIFVCSSFAFQAKKAHRIENFQQVESTTHLFASEEKLRPGSLEAATAELGRVPYGESSRKYRRTVYTHDDWMLHRSNDRLITNLFSMFYSGIVRQVKNKIFLVSIVAISVILWNDVLCANTDNMVQLFDGNVIYLPYLTLPTLPFTLSSPALGLLLVFRTNASYQRWLEARSRWGQIVSQSRNVVRMASTFTDITNEDARQSIDDLALCVWALSRTEMNKLAGSREDEEEYEQQLRKACSDQNSTNGEYNEVLVDRLIQAPDRTTSALMEASLALDSIPVDEKRRCEIDKSLIILGDSFSACERIFTSPVPLVYTRHLARFLSLWLLLFPFAIHDEFIKADQTGLPTLPAAVVLSLFLFGIEELAVQLEEPFSILPMQKFCDEIKSGNERLVEWTVESRKARSS